MTACLYITRTKVYNPRTGRFLQRDILDEKGKDGVYKGFPFGKDAVGTNLYAWAGNNPINRIDPSGQSAFSDSLRSFARALIYAIVYVVKMVMWNNMVRIANQRAQAIKQPPLPVARPRSYAEYVFGRTSGSAGQWQAGGRQAASPPTLRPGTGFTPTYRPGSFYNPSGMLKKNRPTNERDVQELAVGGVGIFVGNIDRSAGLALDSLEALRGVEEASKIGLKRAFIEPAPRGCTYCHYWSNHAEDIPILLKGAVPLD